MCIAIANLKNQALTDEEISNCWANNPDGGGLLYKEDGILKVYKNLDNLDKFLAKYKQVIQNSNVLVHFRVTTGGGVTIKNCHPFLVNKNLGFIHNGVIYGYSNKAADKSDTYSFNELLLKGLPKGFINNEGIQGLIGDAIGTGSKLAFMDKDEKFTIIGEARGIAHYDERGNWLSNDSYKKVNNFRYAGNKKVMNNTSSAMTTKPSAMTTTSFNTVKSTATGQQWVKVFDQADFQARTAKCWMSMGDVPKGTHTEWNIRHQRYVELSPSALAKRVNALREQVTKSELKLIGSGQKNLNYDIEEKVPVAEMIIEEICAIIDQVEDIEWDNNLTDSIQMHRIAGSVIVDPDTDELKTVAQACRLVAESYGLQDEYSWQEIYEEYCKVDTLR